MQLAPLRKQPKASAAHWLSLAAAPTFGGMALLTGIHGDGMPDMSCPAGQGVWAALSGMMPMYLLMSAFHLTPWLRLLSLGASRQIIVARLPVVRRE